MDFGLSEEQAQIVAMVDAFAAEKLAPHTGAWDRDAHFPLDVMREAAGLGLSEQLARVERALLIAALGRQNGRAAEAARALKLPRKTFYDKLARYGIRPEDYRRA